MPPPTPPLLRAEAIAHQRDAPGGLHGVSLDIEPGRFTLLTGNDLSGAALLLRVLGLLERPDSGEIWIDSEPAGHLDDAARLDLRNHLFGYMFAEPFLLDSFSVAENVAMPLFRISGFDIEKAQARTAEVLDFVSLTQLADCGVAGLSPAEHHRIALARALAVSPRILIVEDAGLHLPADDLREFSALLRSVPDALSISLVATSSAPPEMFHPDRAFHLEQGIIVRDSHPVPLHEAQSPPASAPPAHD